MTTPTPARSRSCCSRLVSTPSVTTSTRVPGPTTRSSRVRVPDGVTDVLAEQRSHAAGRGSGGETPWFEQQDATAGQPGLVEQADRDDRRLAGARWGHQDGPAGVVEGAAELGYGRLDRQPAVGQGHRGRGDVLS